MRTPPGAVARTRRVLDRAAALARTAPNDQAAQLGLTPQTPAPGAPPLEPVHYPIDARYLEAWAFRAGLKPVAFITTRPELAQAAVQRFQDAVGTSVALHVERRERLVRVGAQDRWTDRRDVGEPQVELYISRDPALAARAVKVQAEQNPGIAVYEMGRLMGYPPCCVEAFEDQDDRSNNTRNRYLTAARTPGDGPWAAELNNLFSVLYPFFPCQYRCPAATEWVRRSFEEMARQHPAAIQGVRPHLGQPVLYFDHERKLIFDGAMEGSAAVRYRRVWSTPATGDRGGAAGDGFRRWAGVFAQGDCVTFDEHSLVITRDGKTVASWERGDASLGFLAPFSG